MAALIRVFVYGTLKRNQPNHHLLQQISGDGYARFVSPGSTVERYPLIVTGRYNIPYLLASPGDGKNITGEVYDVNQTVLASLDKLERYPEHYDRQLIKVKLTSDTHPGSDITECWCYILPDFRPDLLRLPHIQEFEASVHNFVPVHERGPVVDYDPKNDVRTT